MKTLEVIGTFFTLITLLFITAITNYRTTAVVLIAGGMVYFCYYFVYSIVQLVGSY